MVPKNQKGFTIVELMIAISVFTIAVVIITVGVIAIGEAYLEGVTKTKILTAAREIQNQFTQDIQYSGQAPTSGSYINPGNNTVVNAICIGNERFRYSLPASPNNFFEDINDKSGNATSCQNSGQSFPATDSIIKPLPYNTIVTDFSETTSSGLYVLNIRFVTGDKSFFVNDQYTKPCQSNILGNEFCSVITLNSIVSRKVIN